ncbi:MAG: hypothetical protein B6U87_01870 [Candidatus Aenigmarchaeota archaeon ex4484_52]|nr:MAG: hypothetical protein B6U87_01870 [Candidatus Aenigmarchaeota archaeon ex4484_52]
MKLLIVGREKPTNVILSFLQISKNYFRTVHYASLSNIDINLEKEKISLFSKNKDLLNFDVLFAIPRKKTIDITMSLASIFQINKKYVCIPFNTISLCKDLFLLFFTLNAAKIPIIKTYYATNPEILKRKLSQNQIKLPVIIRPKEEAEIILNNKESIKTVLDTLEKLEQPLIIQELKNDQKINILSIGSSFFSQTNGKKYDLYIEQKNMIYRIKQILNTQIIEIVAYINGNSLIVHSISLTPKFNKFFTLYEKEKILSILCSFIRNSADNFYEKNPIIKIINTIKKY